MSTMIENINSIVATKNELGNILDENGVARPNTFTEYPPLLRSIIQNSSYGADLEERVEDLETDVNAIEQNLTYYATESYVVDYVATYGGGDLSAYVTKTELNNAGYISSIPSYYITDSELSSYGYATETYVVNYVEEHSGGGAVIDENIIPKENNTYTLGTSAYIYNTIYDFYTYSYHLRGINNGTTLCIDGYLNGEYSPTITISGSTIIPGTQNKQVSLGTGLQQFKDAYSYKYYIGDEGEIHDIFTTYAYVVDYVNTHSGGDGITYAYLSANYPTYAYVVDYVDTHSGGVVIDENIIPKANETYTLGSSNYKYFSTYTKNTYTSDIYTYPTGSITIHGYDAWEGTTYDSFYIKHNRFEPYDNNTANLGTQNYQWANTYTYNLILGGTDIKTLINNMFSYDSSTGTLTITTLS